MERGERGEFQTEEGFDRINKMNRMGDSQAAAGGKLGAFGRLERYCGGVAGQVEVLEDIAAQADEFRAVALARSSQINV